MWVGRGAALFPIAMLVACASSSLAAAQAASVAAPAAFGVEGRAPILVAHAVGLQIYECKADPGGSLGWVFREPVASLISGGRTIGVHYHGPAWRLDDGDVVIGKPSSAFPGASPGDVALLKLDVVGHQGGGALAQAKLVLRLNTSGGALSGVCPKLGELRAEPYSADYAFLR
jgi:hypothetical protein